MKEKRLRCRACGTSSHIWARQCQHPAKFKRLVDWVTGQTIPVCGVHANARHAYEYRPSPDSKYERPVEEYLS